MTKNEYLVSQNGILRERIAELEREATQHRLREKQHLVEVQQLKLEVEHEKQQQRLQAHHAKHDLLRDSRLSNNSSAVIDSADALEKSITSLDNYEQDVIALSSHLEDVVLRHADREKRLNATREALEKERNAKQRALVKLTRNANNLERLSRQAKEEEAEGARLRAALAAMKRDVVSVDAELVQLEEEVVAVRLGHEEALRDRAQVLAQLEELAAKKAQLEATLRTARGTISDLLEQEKPLAGMLQLYFSRSHTQSQIEDDLADLSVDQGEGDNFAVLVRQERAHRADAQKIADEIVELSDAINLLAVGLAKLRNEEGLLREGDVSAEVNALRRKMQAEQQTEQQLQQQLTTARSSRELALKRGRAVLRKMDRAQRAIQAQLSQTEQEVRKGKSSPEGVLRLRLQEEHLRNTVSEMKLARLGADHDELSLKQRLDASASRSVTAVKQELEHALSAARRQAKAAQTALAQANDDFLRRLSELDSKYAELLEGTPNAHRAREMMQDIRKLASSNTASATDTNARLAKALEELEEERMLTAELAVQLEEANKEAHQWHSVNSSLEQENEALKRESRAAGRKTRKSEQPPEMVVSEGFESLQLAQLQMDYRQQKRELEEARVEIARLKGRR